MLLQFHTISSVPFQDVGFFKNGGSWLQSSRRGSGRREGRQTWIGFTQQITCKLLRQKSLGKESVGTISQHMCVCVQEAAGNSHYKLFLTVWAAQSHRSFCPGSARYQHPPEKCFSALSKLSSASILEMFLCLATETLLLSIKGSLYNQDYSHQPCMTQTGVRAQAVPWTGHLCHHFHFTCATSVMTGLFQIKKELT